MNGKRRLSALKQKLHKALCDEPEEHPLPDVIQATVENPQELGEHLKVLRGHLLRAAIAWLLATVFSFAFAKQELEFLAAPIGGISHLQAIEVTEPIGIFMRVALLSGFAISLPYIYLELFLFVAPGLRPRARLYGLLGMPLVLLFFLAGAAFAYFVMLPPALPCLLNFMGMRTVPRPASYINFVTALLFWVGVSFEFPLVVYLLVKMRIIKANDLVKHWRGAVVAIAVLAAVITPTVDPVNMLLVMLPLLVLYFISILLAKVAERGRNAEAQRG